MSEPSRPGSTFSSRPDGVASPPFTFASTLFDRRKETHAGSSTLSTSHSPAQHSRAATPASITPSAQLQTMARDSQFIFPSPSTHESDLDAGTIALNAALDREKQRNNVMDSRFQLPLPRRERDYRSMSPQVYMDTRGSTPPRMMSEQPGHELWEEESVGGETIQSSLLSYDVLQSGLTADDRIRQLQGRQVSPQATPQAPSKREMFRPNAEMPFPVTSSLFKKFYPEKKRGPSSSASAGTTNTDFRSALTARNINLPTATPTKRRGLGGGSLFGGQTLDTIKSEEVYEDEDRYESRITQRPSTGRASSEMIENSGIPSYAREFDPLQRWRFEPILTESRHSLSSRASLMSGSRRKGDESLVMAYATEISTQVEQVLRWAKKPFCFTLVVAILGFIINSMFSAVVIPIICSNPAMVSSYPCTLGRVQNWGNGTYYADFPTLMNIESSFEKIVDGAAGGTALARVMKQSEMAVSDLSTVVKYSELKCRDTLSAKLDFFATDAKSSVRALSGWGSKVGGVLDQLLSINQYALRELHSLEGAQPSVWSRLFPFFPPSVPHPNSPATLAAISITFNKAAEVLEHNLRSLVADGETIFSSLTRLTEQHKPIYDEIVREVVDIKKEEEAVLSSLWTWIGGNSNIRKNFRDNAKLLGLIGKYEEEARGYVESTMLELDRMMADLENLRRRVAEPLLVGGAGHAMPVQGSRAMIPLSVHIDAIEKAVERLVRKRGERREREDSYLRKMVERDQRGIGEGIVVE